jgi:hypothetical protein
MTGIEVLFFFAACAVTAGSSIALWLFTVEQRKEQFLDAVGKKHLVLHVGRGNLDHPLSMQVETDDGAVAVAAVVRGDTAVWQLTIKHPAVPTLPFVVVDVGWRDAVRALRGLTTTLTLSNSFELWGSLDVDHAVLLQLADGHPATLTLHNVDGALFMELEREKLNADDVFAAVHVLRCYVAMFAGTPWPAKPATLHHDQTASQTSPSGAPLAVSSLRRYLD